MWRKKYPWLERKASPRCSVHRVTNSAPRQCASADWLECQLPLTKSKLYWLPIHKRIQYTPSPQQTLPKNFPVYYHNHKKYIYIQYTQIHPNQYSSTLIHTLELHSVKWSFWLTWTRLLMLTFLCTEHETPVPDLRNLSLRRSALFRGNFDDWWDLPISTVTTGGLPSDEIGGGVTNASRDQEGVIWLVGIVTSDMQSWTSGVKGNLNAGGGMVCCVMIEGA